MRGTALKMASDRGCLEFVQILLQAGADPDLTGTCVELQSWRCQV